MKDYRFDKGPSLLTLPEMIDELFTLANKNPKDYFTYRKLDNICRYFYEDGMILNAYQGIPEFAGEIEEKAGIQRQVVLNYLRKSALIYSLTSDVFLFRNFHTWSTIWSKSFIKALLQFYRLNAFSTMHGVNRRYFTNPRICQFFDRYATYNGSNP